MKGARGWRLGAGASAGVIAALAAAIALSTPVMAASPWVYLTNYNAPGREGSTGLQIISGTGGSPCRDNWVIEGGGETPGPFGTTNTATGETDCFDPSAAAAPTSSAAKAADMNSCSAGTTSACTARADEAFFQVPGTMSTCAGGGTTLPSIVNGIIAAGGYTATGATVASTEVYDPARNAWYGLSTSLSASRWGLDFGRDAVELSDGRFLVMGGTSAAPSGSTVANVDLFDPATCSWSQKAALDSCTASSCVAREYGAAGVLANGKVVLCGGFTGRDPNPSPMGTCEVYTPSTNTWAAGPSLAGGRGITAPAAYKLNNKGCSTTTTDYSCGERLPGTTSTFPSGRILVASGVSDTNFTNIISRSQECDATSCTTAVPMVRRGTLTACKGALCKGSEFSDATTVHAGAIFSGFKNSAGQAPVLLCGGYGSPYFDIDDGCEVYTPTTSTVAASWRASSLADPLPGPRVDMLLIETCGGGGGSLCSAGFADQIIAAGGSPSYSDNGNTANETTEVDRLSR